VERPEVKPSGDVSVNGAVRWIELGVLVCLVLGVLVIINYLSYRHNQRFDLTPSKTYSLAPQTLSLLDALTDDLNVTIFYKTRDRSELLELAKLFARASERFRYRFMELDKNPARAEALGIKSYGSGVVEYQGRRERLHNFSEAGLVSAIIRLTEKERKMVRFVAGHGEKDLDSADSQNGYARMRQALEAENFQVESFLLMQEGSVPEDTLILVVAGPQSDYFEQEAVMIESYLCGGGNVLMLLDPVRLPVLSEFLERHGIQLANDFIVDTKSKLMSLDYLTPVVLPNREHPVGRHMNQTAVFPYSRSVVPLLTTGSATGMSILVQSGPDSWAERDYQSVYDGRVKFDPVEDLRGPVPVGVATTCRVDGVAGQLVVYGDADFANNHYMSMLGNMDLLLNTVNWLAEKSSLLSPRAQPTHAPVSLLFLTQNQARLVLWSSVIIQPALVLLIGLAVVFRRRRK
jgi:ABC-type uncharacterized transport system involved in gliding motility auxiliary subunit